MDTARAAVLMSHGTSALTGGDDWPEALGAAAAFSAITDVSLTRYQLVISLVTGMDETRADRIDSIVTQQKFCNKNGFF